MVSLALKFSYIICFIYPLGLLFMLSPCYIPAVLGVYITRCNLAPKRSLPAGICVALILIFSTPYTIPISLIDESLVNFAFALSILSPIVVITCSGILYGLLKEQDTVKASRTTSPYMRYLIAAYIVAGYGAYLLFQYI